MFALNYYYSSVLPSQLTQSHNIMLLLKTAVRGFNATGVCHVFALLEEGTWSFSKLGKAFSPGFDIC